jgi:hypothetical protein
MMMPFNCLFIVLAETKFAKKLYGTNVTLNQVSSHSKLAT